MTTTEIPTSDELQVLVEKLVSEHDCPGASAAMGAGDGLSVGVAGVLNLNTGVEVTPDSLFQIGSNTKVYNATMVMQLVDEGKVDLDEPALTYLPEFRLADAEATKSITVRHLLTHTSGIDGGDYIEEFGRGEDALAKYVASLVDVGLVHPIGKFWSYCNAATVVAGRIIEVLTELPWHDALKARLVEPLGLRHTVALPEEAILFRVSAGHMSDPLHNDETRVFPTWSLPFGMAPAGATINATASDVVAFGRFHLRDGVAADGTRVLSAQSARAMRETQFGDVTSSASGSQGIAWRLAQEGPFNVVAHGGGTLGQASQFIILPDQDVSLAILTNGPGGGAVIAGVVKEVMTRLGGEEMAALAAAQEAAAAAVDDAPTPPVQDVDVDLTKYVGVYERKDMTTRIDLTDGALVAGTEMFGYLARMPSQKPMTLEPLNETTFVVLDAAGKPVSQVTFSDLDDEGRPGYLIMGRVSRRVG